MSAAVIDGQITYNATRDMSGNRVYRVVHLVKTTDTLDGPQIVMNAAGLPAIGSIWNFDNDQDQWAWCTPQMRISIHKEKEADPPNIWRVEQTFTTSGGENGVNRKRCQDIEVGNPLTEPQEISGGSQSETFETGLGYETEALAAAGGERVPLITPSFEVLRGVQVSDGRDSIRIGQNVPALGWAAFAAMRNTVNDAPIWGFPTRGVLLKNTGWERLVYGTCTFYYKRFFEFEVDPSTFDFKQPAYGKMVFDTDIAGGDRTNPKHYKRYTDNQGNLAQTFMKENGDAVATIDEAYQVDVIYYKESNFLLLGIPTNIG